MARFHRVHNSPSPALLSYRYLFVPIVPIVRDPRRYIPRRTSFEISRFVDFEYWAFEYWTDIFKTYLPELHDRSILALLPGVLYTETWSVRYFSPHVCVHSPAISVCGQIYNCCCPTPFIEKYQYFSFAYYRAHYYSEFERRR